MGGIEQHPHANSSSDRKTRTASTKNFVSKHVYYLCFHFFFVRGGGVASVFPREEKKKTTIKDVFTTLTSPPKPSLTVREPPQAPNKRNPDVR